MFARKLLIGFAIGMAALSQTACSSGSGGFVSGIDLEQKESNGIKYLEIKTQINTAGLNLSSITVPIYHPRQPAHQIGQLSLIGGLGGATSELVIQLRSDILPRLPATGSGLLPNGTLIPIAGVNAKKWLTVSLSSHSKIYLNIDVANSKAIIGAALSVDGLTTGVVGNVLIPFNKNNISGVAGIYSGARPGQSGFALFLDASSALKKAANSDSGLVLASTEAPAESVSSKAPVQFLMNAPSNDAVRIQKRILQLQEGSYLLRVR